MQQSQKISHFPLDKLAPLFSNTSVFFNIKASYFATLWMNAVNSDNVDQMLALAKMLNVRKEFEFKYFGRKEDQKIFGKVRCDKLLLSAIQKLTKNDIERNIQVSNVIKEILCFFYTKFPDSKTFQKYAEHIYQISNLIEVYVSIINKVFDKLDKDKMDERIKQLRSSFCQWLKFLLNFDGSNLNSNFHEEDLKDQVKKTISMALSPQRFFGGMLLEVFIHLKLDLYSFKNRCYNTEWKSYFQNLNSNIDVFELKEIVPPFFQTMRSLVRISLKNLNFSPRNFFFYARPLLNYMPRILVCAKSKQELNFLIEKIFKDFFSGFVSFYNQNLTMFSFEESFNRKSSEKQLVRCFRDTNLLNCLEAAIVAIEQIQIMQHKQIKEYAYFYEQILDYFRSINSIKSHIIANIDKHLHDFRSFQRSKQQQRQSSSQTSQTNIAASQHERDCDDIWQKVSQDYDHQPQNDSQNSSNIQKKSRFELKNNDMKKAKSSMSHPDLESQMTSIDENADQDRITEYEQEQNQQFQMEKRDKNQDNQQKSMFMSKNKNKTEIQTNSSMLNTKDKGNVQNQRHVSGKFINKQISKPTQTQQPRKIAYTEDQLRGIYPKTIESYYEHMNHPYQSYVALIQQETPDSDNKVSKYPQFVNKEPVIKYQNFAKEMKLSISCFSSFQRRHKLLIEKPIFQQKRFERAALRLRYKGQSNNKVDKISFLLQNFRSKIMNHLAILYPFDVNMFPLSNKTLSKFQFKVMTKHLQLFIIDFQKTILSEMVKKDVLFVTESKIQEKTIEYKKKLHQRCLVEQAFNAELFKLKDPFDFNVKFLNEAQVQDLFFTMLYYMLMCFKENYLKDYLTYFDRNCFEKLDIHLQSLLLYYMFELTKIMKQAKSTIIMETFVDIKLQTPHLIEIMKRYIFQLKLNHRQMQYLYQKIYPVIFKKSFYLLNKTTCNLQEVVQSFNKQLARQKQGNQAYMSKNLQLLKTQFVQNYSNLIDLMNIYLIMTHSMVKISQNNGNEKKLFYCGACMTFTYVQYNCQLRTNYQKMLCEQCPNKLLQRFELQYQNPELIRSANITRRQLEQRIQELLISVRSWIQDNDWQVKAPSYTQTIFWQEQSQLFWLQPRPQPLQVEVQIPKKGDKARSSSTTDSKHFCYNYTRIFEEYLYYILKFLSY